MAKTVQIKGYTPEEACNSEAAKIQERWNKAIDERKALLEEQHNLVNRLDLNATLFKQLRREEACNVIDYVRSRLNRLSQSRIDTLLCHCQNMLNGNIDNIVLTFSEGDLEK